MPGLQSKVPRLLVEPPPDSLRRVARINPCSQPHGIFIIDEQEVPCDSILTLKADNIEDIRVLSISETHELYGNRGDPYGALVLITKVMPSICWKKNKAPIKTKSPDDQGFLLSENSVFLIKEFYDVVIKDKYHQHD